MPEPQLFFVFGFGYGHTAARRRDRFVYEIDSACTQGKLVIARGDWVKDR
jgi:hypothetical protein